MMNGINQEIKSLRRIAHTCKSVGVPVVSPYIFATCFHGALNFTLDCYQIERDRAGLSDDRSWDVDEWESSKVIIGAMPRKQHFRLAYRAMRLFRSRLALPAVQH